MPTISIDGKEYEVGEDRNVLQAALDHKLDLPYFCWHPAMGSMGACRLCAVKQYRDETDETGRLTMGCMTPAIDGVRVSIADPEAARFRRSVIEWLMINHPHDCPVCDEGGECHLQDMTIMTGHAQRRYRGRKRTYRNQYLGPFIHHEMNRCIQCYRCVRFYNDHAGGNDLGVFASRDRVYFGRTEDGVLESPFAGNLVEVCPTGVFTDKTSRRHYTRKWDLQSAASLCVHCGLGCNTIIGAHNGTLRRVMSRFNADVNGYWLCDRGRFGYEYANADDRLVTPQGRTPGAADWPAIAIEMAAFATDGKLAAFGSPRASLETNFVLRELVGAERYCPGVADAERAIVDRFVEAALRGCFHVPSLQEVARADVVVVLAADLTNEAPLLDLASFRAREGGAGVFVAATRRGRVNDFATASVSATPGALAELVTALAACIGEAADPAPPPRHTEQFVTRAARALAAAKRPLIVTGTQHRDVALFAAILELVDALNAQRESPAWFCLAVPEANSIGVALLDAGEGPGVDDLVASIESGAVAALVVCENDLFSRYAHAERLAAALRQLDELYVFDHLITSTAAIASRLLPVATVTESSGTLVSNEGRIQRFFAVLRPLTGVAPAWSLFRDVLMEAREDGTALDWQHLDDVSAVLAERHPVLEAPPDVAPPAGFNQSQIEVGGPPHDGDPGRRVFSVNGGGPVQVAAGPPVAAAAATDGGGVLLCSTAEIFGSEVLSRRAPAIAELTPPPYLLLHPDRAAELGVEAGRSYRLALRNGNRTRHVKLTVETDASLPIHVAAVPAGYPETRWWQHPERVDIEVTGDAESAGADAREKEPTP